jgi:hypothetical protein
VLFGGVLEEDFCLASACARDFVRDVADRGFSKALMCRLLGPIGESDGLHFSVSKRTESELAQEVAGHGTRDCETETPRSVVSAVWGVGNVHDASGRDAALELYGTNEVWRGPGVQ